MRVVVEGLAHRFPGTDLLFEHLDFVAEPGSTIAVCGPSGCGKSTLLSILAGWEKPYAGTVTREGVNRVGWVFQNPYGVAERTALDHVVVPLLAKGMRRKEAEPKALEAMGLLPTLVPKIFKAIHEPERTKLDTEAQITAWLAKQGVDKAKFSAMFNSFAIGSKATRATKLQDAYQLDGVPSMGVAGQFLTNGTMAGSMPRMLQVVSSLIAQQK